MSLNDEEKQKSIEDESHDAARMRLERRRASKNDDSRDDDIFDLSGRGAYRAGNAQRIEGNHVGGNAPHSRTHGRSARSDYRGARYIAASLSSLSSIPRSVVICVVAVLVIFFAMVVASRFGHTPEVASLDAAEQAESVGGEGEDASVDAETSNVDQGAEVADFSLLPAGLDAKTRETLESQSDDPRIVSIVNNVAALGKTGEHYQLKMLELAAKDPQAINYVLDFPQRYPASSGESYSDSVERGTVPDLKQWDERWGYVEYCGAAIGSTGCCPTSLSMVYMALTGKTDKTPADMAALATADGFAVDGEGTIGDFLVDDASKLGLACDEFSPSAANLVRYLKNGYVVVVNVGQGDFTDSGHFFVARGVASDGSIQINDPYSSVNTAKTWDANTIVNQSIAMYAFHVA